jgi:hypothetical protein
MPGRWEWGVSGYRNSGLSEKDYEDRQALLDAVEVIRGRWPSLAAGFETPQYRAIRTLRSAVDQIERAHDGE